MAAISELYQSADWKSEKHVPVIESPESVGKGELIPVTVTIGKQVAHPNTTEHHIRWIDVFFQPQGSKFPYQIGRAEFSAHGASTRGPDSSGVYTHHEVSLRFKTDKSGMIYASSYCNIHGLWQSTVEIAVS